MGNFGSYGKAASSAFKQTIGEFAGTIPIPGADEVGKAAAGAVIGLAGGVWESFCDALGIGGPSSGGQENDAMTSRGWKVVRSESCDTVGGGVVTMQDDWGKPVQFVEETLGAWFEKAFPLFCGANPSWRTTGEPNRFWFHQQAPGVMAIHFGKTSPKESLAGDLAAHALAYQAYMAKEDWFILFTLFPSGSSDTCVAAVIEDAENIPLGGVSVAGQVSFKPRLPGWLESQETKGRKAANLAAKAADRAKVPGHAENLKKATETGKNSLLSDAILPVALTVAATLIKK